MASIISAGTTSGTSLNLSGDTSGVLQLASNGSTTAVTVDTSQNVGIGTASPTGKLNVHGGAGNSKVKLSNTLSGNGNGDGFDLDFTGTDIYITNRENGFMAFENNGAERMRIPAAGGVQVVTCVSVGNATPSTSGAGITFPATQSASTNANTLDDYEEGTWTATVTTSGYTISSQTCNYVKIGKSVIINFRIEFSAVGAQNSSVILTGLPFTVNNTVAGTGAVRENSNTGTIYMVNTGANSNTLEINSYSGVANGSARTIATSEAYVATVTYFV
jgi:hypothetical protein